MLRDRPYLQNIKLGRAEDVAMLRSSAESQRRAACGEATDNQSLIPDSTAAGRLGRARRSGSGEAPFITIWLRPANGRWAWGLRLGRGSAAGEHFVQSLSLWPARRACKTERFHAFGGLASRAA